jgi:hypothetical protein
MSKSNETLFKIEQAQDFLINWLDEQTLKHPPLDDFIVSIQNHPDKMNAVIQVIAIMMTEELLVMS